MDTQRTLMHSELPDFSFFFWGVRNIHTQINKKNETPAGEGLAEKLRLVTSVSVTEFYSLRVGRPGHFKAISINAQLFHQSQGCWKWQDRGGQAKARTHLLPPCLSHNFAAFIHHFLSLGKSGEFGGGASGT